MANPVPVNATDPFAKSREEPKTSVLAGSVSATERGNVLTQMAEDGFENMSEGVREVCLAYYEVPEIRTAVLDHWRKKKAA